MRPRSGDLQINVPQTQVASSQFSPIRMSPGASSPHMTPAEKMLQATDAILVPQRELALQLNEVVQILPGPSRFANSLLLPLQAAQPAASARPSVLEGVPAADAAVIHDMRRALTPPEGSAGQLKDIDARCMTLERLSIGLAASKVPGGLEALRQQAAGEQKQTIITGLQALAAQAPGATPVNQRAVDLVSQAVQLMLDNTQPAPAATPHVRPS